MSLASVVGSKGRRELPPRGLTSTEKAPFWEKEIFKFQASFSPEIFVGSQKSSMGKFGDLKKKQVDCLLHHFFCAVKVRVTCSN